jgi:hypothetical protein
VFENSVLRWIFVAERDKITGEWRKFHIEELHNVYSSPNIIRQMKLRMPLAGRVHDWERREKCTKFWWESPKERNHSEDRVVDGRMGSE